MQKWKRNQIFEAIQSVGLDAKDFDFEDGDAGVQIKHKWSDSYFIIGGDPGHYVGRYVVGDSSDWQYEVYTWESIIRRVSGWVEEVKRDLETPDLWAELQRETELLVGASNKANENTPFTPEEQKEIVGQLQEMAEYAKRRYSLSGPEMQILNAKLDYLVRAAGRLGRIDWLNVFAGVILGFILTAAVPPESARHILLELLRAIGHLFGQPKLPGG
jgi:hypothetical protein